MRKALIVGIDSYKEQPLSCCVKDATALAILLETNGDGSPNFDVRQDVNIPTKAILKKAITELFATKCDSALLYFSGHGYFNDTGGGYIVTPDYKPHDEGISMDEILNLANKSKASNKVIILDCCFSGAMGSPASINNTVAQISEGVSILTASRSDESAIEVNGHGIFTNLLLDALQGGAGDIRGYITTGSIYAYVDQALGPWDQRPVFKTNITSFNHLRTVMPHVSIEALRKLTEYFPTPTTEFPLDPSFEYTNTEVASPTNVAIFKTLQKFESVGLVVPVDEEHMYWAAQNSKSCKLTALGYHYWRLVDAKRI